MSEGVLLPPLTANTGNNSFCNCIWKPFSGFPLNLASVRPYQDWGACPPQCPLWAELCYCGPWDTFHFPDERSAYRTPQLMWYSSGDLLTLSKPSGLGRPVGTFIIVSPGYVSPVQEQDRLSCALPSLLPTSFIGGWCHCFALLFLSKGIVCLHLSQMHRGKRADCHKKYLVQDFWPQESRTISKEI